MGAKRIPDPDRKKTASRKISVCLRCNGEFISRHKFNRICGQCKVNRRWDFPSEHEIKTGRG